MILFVSAERAEAICVSIPKAKIRIGPGKFYEVLWEVYKYTPLMKVGRSLSGDWYAVRDVDGDVNWIYKKSVTSSYRCAIVKTNHVNVRTAPGSSKIHSTLSPALHYDLFRVLEKKGKWVKVKDENGDKGWIHKDFLWVQ